MKNTYKFSIIFTIAIAIMLTAIACNAQAPILKEDKTYTYKAVPSEKDNFSYAQFSIWFPENIKSYKGILYLGAGYEYSSIPMAYDEAWRELARENEFVILTSHMRSRTEANPETEYWQAEYGSGQAMLDALKHFAKEAEHPEIEYAPLAMWGFSAGGQFNYHFACWKPERVITFVAIKGGYFLSEPKDEVLKIPALWFTGENDLQRRIDAVNEMFDKNIKREPLWCLANEPGADHVIGKTDDLAIPWLKEVIKQRLPENPKTAKKAVTLKNIEYNHGWLGDRIDGYTAPALNYNKEKYSTSWIPNEELAKLWNSFHLHR